MKESIYIHATKKAWHFTWKHKILWFFGIFAAFLGQFGIVEFLGKIGVDQGGVGSQFGTIGYILSQIGKFLINAGNSYDSKIILFFLLTLILCIAVVVVFLSVASQGALLYAGSESIKHEKVNNSKSWHVGVANFWRLFFLNFFKKIIIAVIIVVLSLSIYGALLSPSIPNSIVLTLAVIVFAVAGLILSLLFFYSAGYLVIEKETMYVSIKKAWKMFLAHPVVSFEIALLVVVLNMFFGILLAFGFILLVLPPMLLWFALIVAGGSQVALTATFFASLIVFAMYIMVAGAGFTVFTTYIWTYTFLEMHHKGVASRFVNFFRSLLGRE